MECIPSGIFEWNTVNDTLVHHFENVTGYLTASLGDDYILVSDAATNLVTILTPQGTSEPLPHAWQCLRHAYMGICLLSPVE